MALKGVGGKTDSQKRREHEELTGCRENMSQLGWTCRRYSSKGEPVEFARTVRLNDATYPCDTRIVRTHGKLWRMELDTGYKIPLAHGLGTATAKRKLDTPLLPGPVAMAIWFEVENSNGSIRFGPR